MTFQMQKRLLVLGTVITLIIASSIFTYITHSQNESARYRVIEDKLRGDAKSILAHLYSSGNWAWFNDTLESYKKLGVTCLSVKSNTGEHIWGQQDSCSKNIEAKNYIDQKILDISYDLPQVTILSTLKKEGFALSTFFITMLSFLALAYFLFKKITMAHTETLIKIENLNSLNSANEKLLKITRTLAHNLRSPLAAIKSFNELVEGKLEQTEVKILNATHESIANMVEKLIEQKTVKVETSLISLSSSLESIVGMKKIEHKKNDFVQFSMNIEDKLSSFVNEAEFMSIISNLVNNSIEAKKDNALMKIEISALQNDNKALIKIKDNGIGIKNGDLQHIFTYGKTTKVNGKGCGLYHAKEMIELWGGEIAISSVENIFTEVTIMLPLHKKPRQIVLIDNESLNIFNWQGLAKKNDISFTGYKSSDEFFLNPPKAKDDVAIFVDYELDNENGVEVVKKLRDAGFSNITLATGEIEQINPQIRQVGKEFPKEMFLV